MVKKIKYQIILFLLLIVGLIIVVSILKSHEQKEREKYDLELVKAKNEAIVKIETGIDVYATLVASLKSFFTNAAVFPSEQETHLFLKDMVKDAHFHDSIVVSWVDTNHVFQYCITPFTIDPGQLKGKQLKDFRPFQEIVMLDSLMSSNNIQLFPPINLIEGIAAFPFVFALTDYKEEKLGYIAPVMDVKYLLNRIYKNDNAADFTYQFVINDSIYFDREAVYDGTTIYNLNKDSLFFKNFDIARDEYIHDKINFFDLSIQVGVAHKHPFQANTNLNRLAYLWYGLFLTFSVFLIYQTFKIVGINRALINTKRDLEAKNRALEKSVQQVKTLIKEVHHRVKNNLQIIGSLMNLQSYNETDDRVKNALQKSKNRIESMSLVHQKLYGESDLSSVNLKEYLQQLIENIKKTIDSEEKEVSLTLETNTKITLPMDLMTPLGLILNELISNSFKYAFLDKSGYINISLTEKSNLITLIYKDSGDGIPDGVNFNDNGTLGFELMHLLTEQIGGKLTYNEVKKEFTLQFKNTFSE